MTCLSAYKKTTTKLADRFTDTLTYAFQCSRKKIIITK
jgi:hypothetical protein